MAREGLTFPALWAPETALHRIFLAFAHSRACQERLWSDSGSIWECPGIENQCFSLRKTMIFKKSAFAIRSASNASQMCPTGPEKLPKAAHVEPKGVPRVPQSGSKSSLLPFWSIPNTSESHMLDQMHPKAFQQPSKSDSAKIF